MRITCSKCNTNFLIIPEKLGMFGRNVKCSKCMNIWHQSIPSEEVEINAVNDDYLLNQYLEVAIPARSEHITLPIISHFRKKKYHNIKLYIYSIIILIILALASFNYLRFNNDKIIIKDVKYVPLHDSSIIKIHYKIINSSNEAVQMPLVRIRLFDINNNIIKYYISERLNIMLQPKQHINMKTELSSPLKNIDHAEVTIGNRIDFLLK